MESPAAAGVPPLVGLRGDVHDARSEGTVPVDIYVTYVLTPGSGDAGLFIAGPDYSNPDCHFAK